MEREQQHDAVSLAEKKPLNIHALFQEERVFRGDALEAAGPGIQGRREGHKTLARIFLNDKEGR